MANTTFNGPVRAENGFIGVTKDSSTGAITENITFGNNGVVVAPVALGDEDKTMTAAANGGRVNVVPALASNRTITLPAPTAGLSFTFINGGGAEETENVIFITPGNTNFFLGGVIHLTGTPASVYPNGSSNSQLTLEDFGLFEITFIAKDSTNWYVSGYQQGADAPAFADQ